MTHFWQDVRYGLRLLAKNPGFTAVAVLTLALGIGANSALFSVVNGVLLNPLPFPNPEEIYVVYSSSASFQHSSISYPNFLDWQKENHSFAALGGFRSANYNLTGSGEPERLHAHMISAEFMPAFGIRPIIGRNFTPEEDRAGGAPVVILGDKVWKRKFANSPDVLGKSVTLNATSYTIIGVAQSKITDLGDSDVFVPIGQWTDPTFLNRRISMGMVAIGRLKPGVSFPQAQAEMDGIAKSLAAAYPDANEGRGIALVPLKTDTVGDVQATLWVLMGAVGFVLLIACANVANLLLARSTGRAREFALRAALGASPARVIRQLLTESVLLGLAGGGLGLLLAKFGTRAVLAAVPDLLPRTDGITLDWHVLLFTVGASVLTGIIFGLVPAFKILRPDVHGTLKEGGRGGSGARHRTQSIFIIAETALALVLLVGAGLMIRSLSALWGLDPGFDPRHVLSFNLSWTSDPKMTADQLRAKHRETIRQLEAAPGVEALSIMGGSLPMDGDSEVPFWLEGQPKPVKDNDAPTALFYLITPGYQQAMTIPLKRGRLFNEHDNEHSHQVALIDESFARKYFPKEDPIGKRLNVGLLEMQPEIVGVVGHVEHWGLGSKGHEDLQSQLYLPVWQIPDAFWPLLANEASYVARTPGAPMALERVLREAGAKVDATSVLYALKPMEEIVANSISQQRFAMLLLSAFSALALVLSAVGLYGVISYVSAQRTHEIGVRMALGATGSDVLRMVLGEGMKISAIGVGIGLAAALGLTRLIAKLIYGVSVMDPVTFIGVAALLLGVSLLACYVPAHRAMRVDPIIALRYE
jgi:predicted permease